MKKLSIIVPKDSQIDSFLSESFYIYDKIVRLVDRTCYIINVSHPMSMIDYLISVFEPKVYSTHCNYGRYIFRVRS